jgi:hypothetical protein
MLKGQCGVLKKICDSMDEQFHGKDDEVLARLQ